MLDEFIDFTQALFPSISPYIQNKTKEAIEQFNLIGKQANFFNYSAYDFFAQGDIFDGIPFIKVEDDGKISAEKGKGMLISNTCSAEHDEDVVMAPLLEMDKMLGINKENVKKNLYYRLLYLPDPKYENYAVDFSLLNTFNKNSLIKMIEERKIVKETSLNQLGFYLLICKLTVCFLRPEDESVQDDRHRNYTE